MAKFMCPTCDMSRHVAEPGSGEVVETTGKKPTVDCCWYCGTPTSEPRLRKLATEHVRVHAHDESDDYRTKHVDVIVRRAEAALTGEKDRPWTHSHAASEFGYCTDCDAAVVLERYEEGAEDG